MEPLYYGTFLSIEVFSIQRLVDTVEPLYCGHFGTLEIVLSIEVSSIQRLDNTVEPLYCGHFGTLEIVLSIEVSSIQRLDNAVEPLYCGHFGNLENILSNNRGVLNIEVIITSLLWTLWDLGNCP